jgi:hypothetical protein
VGEVSNIVNNMWYYEGDWLPTDSDLSSEFMGIAGKLDTRAVMETPSKGLLAYMKYAVVHLTFSKKRKYKFPKTKFY